MAKNVKGFHRDPPTINLTLYPARKVHGPDLEQLFKELDRRGMDAALFLDRAKLDASTRLSVNLGILLKRMPVEQVLPHGLSEAELRALQAVQSLGADLQATAHSLLNIHERAQAVQALGPIWNAVKSRDDAMRSTI